MSEAASRLAAGRNAEPQTLEAAIPVAEVTLLEDRGLVRRRGRITIPPGRARLEIEGAAPVLADKTLTAALQHPDGSPLPEGVRARDATVERWWVRADADRPTDVAELRNKLRAMVRQRDEARQRLSQIEGEAVALGQLVELTYAELTEDVAWGRDDLAESERELDDIEAKIAALGLQACGVRRELQDVQREIKDLQILATATTPRDADARAKITVELVNPTADDVDAELVIDYLVPGALWRPCHTAQLVEGPEGARLVLRTDGCVWQSTGEEWVDVQLLFSTERPSLGVEPPLLHTDQLYARKRGSDVHVAAREQAIHTAGLGQGEAPEEAADELPGIDDGGEAVELRARTRATVPPDGRPYRVPIVDFESEAEVALVCTPELAEAVLLRTRQVNRGRLPLLAGPVDLVRDSGLVGRTSTLYVAPGERFELGWGPDRGLRVRREVELLEETRRTLSSWTRKPRRVTIKLSNVSAKSATIEVKERIATSEIEKVEVEHDHASRSATADSDGFVTWMVPLRGFGREELQLQWTLVVHDDVTGL